MDRESREITAVERATEHAWKRVPKPGQHFCVELLPPREPFVLDAFVWCVKEWLLENASDLFEGVFAVRGTTSWREAHAWIMAWQIGEPKRQLLIDVSTPLGNEMHLVASDATLAYAAKNEHSIYFRRISIVPMESAGAYERTMVMSASAEPTSVVPRTAIAEVLLAFVTRSCDRMFIPLDAHVDQLATCFVAVEDAQNAGCLAAARPYARVLYALLREIWTFIFEFHALPANAAELFERVDIAWRVVFGLSLTWRRQRSDLSTCASLSTNERHNLSDVSIAYQRVLGAFETVVRETDDHVMARTAKGRFPYVRVPYSRTPAHDLLLHLLTIDADTVGTIVVPHDVAFRVGARYPPNVLYLLERVAELVMSGRTGDDASFKMIRGEIDVMRMNWAKAVPAELQIPCEMFFTNVLRFAHGTSANLERFQSMLGGWLELDVHYLIPELPPAPELVPAAPEPPPEPARAPRMTVCFRHELGRATPLQIEYADADQCASETWDTVGEIRCFRGTAWTLEVRSGVQALAGEMHTLMCSLVADCAPNFVTADAMRITAELPPHARLPEQRMPWVRKAVPHAVLALVNRLCVAPVAADTWPAYTECVRRAVQILRAADVADLGVVHVPCPRAFGIAELDPEMHEIDQWLMYFMTMPTATYGFLDMQRKRFGIGFFLQRMEDGGAERLMTRVVMRRPPCALAMGPSSGGLRTSDARIADTIWDWVGKNDDDKSAVIAVPEALLRPSIAAAVNTNKLAVRAEHISDDYLRVHTMLKDFLHVGMLFATRKNRGIELEVFRDVSYYFELSFTKKMLALPVAVRAGELADTESTALHIELSKGYLANCSEPASEHVASTLIVRPGEWHDDTLAFLAGWVRTHLCRAVQTALVVLRVTPLRIELLPSVQLVCREHGVYFTVTAHLSNKLEGVCSETFVVHEIPAVDAATHVCTVNLGPVVARWFGNRVLSYGDAAGTHVRVAPYTHALGKVYMNVPGCAPITMGTFDADSSKLDHVRGAGVHVDCDTYTLAADAVAVQQAHAECHRIVVFGIMCGDTVRPSDDNALRAVHSLAVYKYYEGFKCMPIHESLAERVPKDEFARAVLREYYTNTHLHPAVRSVVCKFDAKKFVHALYGRTNAFLSTIQ